MKSVPPGPNTSQLAVARLAGVSAMTVSRVIHHSPRVSPATRRKVEAAMRKLGYRPDPKSARLMSLVRRRKKRHPGNVIAIIRDKAAEGERRDGIHQYVSLEDIESRAAQHGYHAEEFWLGQAGLTPARLKGILLARGIEGVIVSPLSTFTLAREFDYRPFAAATFGYGLSSPALHRASTNMTQGIREATARLTERGYRRIGLAITPWVDQRSDHTYSAAMLFYQRTIPPKSRVPLMIFPHNDLRSGKKLFCGWMKKYRPDAVISFHTLVPDWLRRDLGRRIPEDIGLVVHDWTPTMTNFAGIYLHRPEVAAATVDLVATQLLQNEKGIPAVARNVLIPPEWKDGPTLPPGLTKSG